MLGSESRVTGREGYFGSWLVKKGPTPAEVIHNNKDNDHAVTQEATAPSIRLDMACLKLEKSRKRLLAPGMFSGLPKRDTTSQRFTEKARQVSWLTTANLEEPEEKALNPSALGIRRFATWMHRRSVYVSAGHFASK